MIKHIVMWKLRDKADAVEIKARLEALNGKIPGLIKIEAGIDFLGSEQSADVVLYSEFKSEADLKTYIAHPAHQEAVAVIVPLVSERRVADYSL